MRSVSPQQQLDLFYSMPGDIAARDAQDLMSWPFFSLAKSRRSAPIDFAMGATWISVEAVAEHGMATIWDADILIWAASQLVEARDAGRPTSRHIAARPHEILTFIGRGTGKDHYERLRAALDRLQSTTVAGLIAAIWARVNPAAAAREREEREADRAAIIKGLAKERQGELALIETVRAEQLDELAERQAQQLRDAESRYKADEERHLSDRAEADRLLARIDEQRRLDAERLQNRPPGMGPPGTL